MSPRTGGSVNSLYLELQDVHRLSEQGSTSAYYEDLLWKSLPLVIALVGVCLQHSTCPGCAANMTQDEGHDDGCPLAPFEEPLK